MGGEELENRKKMRKVRVAAGTLPEASQQEMSWKPVSLLGVVTEF